MSDEQLFGEAAKLVQVLYERQRCTEEGTGVVSGLLDQGLGTSGSATGAQGVGEPQLS